MDFLKPYFLFILSLGCLVLPSLGQTVHGVDSTEVPLLIGESTSLQDDLYSNWLIQGAEAALNGGFSDLAISLGTQALLANGVENPSNNQSIRLILATAYINRGQIELAREQIGFLPYPEDPVALLRLAIVQFMSAEYSSATTLLENLDSMKLPSFERAWYNLVSALLLLEEKQTEEANAMFSLAKRTAPSGVLREQFELIRLRYEIQNDEVDEEEINALRGTVRSFSGERSGFEAARLLAIALYSRGEIQEAINFLSLQLQQPGISESGLKPNLLLLIGLFAGEESFQGRLALNQLVAEGGNRELQGIALTLLAQAPLRGENQDDFIESIDQWLGQIGGHPLAGRLYLYRAFLFADLTDFAEAEKSALNIINNNPNSSLVIPSLRLLAYISWSRIPSQYRTAADYLSRLRERLPAGVERVRTTHLMADCFFLNGDFPSASEAYASVLRDPKTQQRKEILFQQVLSEIKSERLDRAMLTLDQSLIDNWDDNPELYWKAEWNIIEALKRKGRFDEAEARLTQLLDLGSGVELDPALVFRFKWLQLRLWTEIGRISDVLEKIDNVAGEVDQSEFSLESFKSLLLGQLLLLKGEALYATGESLQAATVFLDLRERFPGSGSAILSFLIEARQSASEDGLVNAQQSLIRLADIFPENEFAPIALWEAAINAEQRGLNQHLQESITLLERLVNDYPNHRLVYFARLKQGDLSRRLNDFSTALLIYERLLNQFPSHPERFRAELSRADCFFAQAGQNNNRYDDASVIYERLVLLPQTPFNLRMEAAFKLSQTFYQQGLEENRQNSLWLIYDRQIRNLSAERISTSEFKRARYWMSRILLELAQIFENKGELNQAARFYESHLKLNLPGKNLAESQLNQLQKSL